MVGRRFIRPSPRENDDLSVGVNGEVELKVHFLHHGLQVLRHGLGLQLAEGVRAVVRL